MILNLNIKKTHNTERPFAKTFLIFLIATDEGKVSFLARLDLSAVSLPLNITFS